MALLLVKCGLVQGWVRAVTFLHGEMAVVTFGLRRKKLIAGLIAAPSPPSVCLCFLMEECTYLLVSQCLSGAENSAWHSECSIKDYSFFIICFY